MRRWPLFGRPPGSGATRRTIATSRTTKSLRPTSSSVDATGRARTPLKLPLPFFDFSSDLDFNADGVALELLSADGQLKIKRGGSDGGLQEREKRLL